MYNEYNLEATLLNQAISSFKKFLAAEKISPGSSRSYLSDVRHFLGWLTFFLESNKIIANTPSLNLPYHPLTSSNPMNLRGNLEETKGKIEDVNNLATSSSSFHPLSSNFLPLLKHVNQKTLEAYKNYLTSNNIPTKTINRRFSSLRKFGSFCQSQNWLPHNYFDTLKTIVIDKPFPENEWHLGEFKANLWKNNATKSTIKNYLNDAKQFIVWYGRLLKWFTRITSGLTRISAQISKKSAVKKLF